MDNWVKFYSIDDLACGFEINNIIDNINVNYYDEITTIKELIISFNTLKYFVNQSFVIHIESKTIIKIDELSKKINMNIGKYLNSNKNNYINLFDELDVLYIDDYFEILEKYKIFECLENLDVFKNKENFNVLEILKFPLLVRYFDLSLKEHILEDSVYSECILNKFCKNWNIFLPQSLTHSDIIDLIEAYIDSEHPNINYLRDIINFPSNNEFKITDKIRLKATKREKTENDKLFKEGSGYQNSVSLRFLDDFEETIKFLTKGTNLEITVNENWIKENDDFPTLWNNFIYLFSIVNINGILLTVSNTNGGSSIEKIWNPKVNYMFWRNSIFVFWEMYVYVVVEGYISTLSKHNIKIENMIEWFFKSYLKDEFKIENFDIYLPLGDNSYFEKCRTIIPEIDKIFKQYNTYIENRNINQELIQISSFSYMTNQIASLNDKKYAYPVGDWFDNLSFLLFSDQSTIFYLKKFDDKYKNFFELVLNEDVKKSDFREHQINRIQILIDEKIIHVNNLGHFEFSDLSYILILKEFYSSDVISYWHKSVEYRNILDNLHKNNQIIYENTLLTRNEQDYFDYYLNRSKFTNSLDIRNRYLHGTNTNCNSEHKTDYYRVIKLLIYIVLKINDDITINIDIVNQS